MQLAWYFILSLSVGGGSQLTMPLFALVGGEAHSLFLESTIGSLFSLRSSFFTFFPICLYQVSLNAILHYKRTFPGKVLVVSWPRRHRVRSSALGKISKWRISTNFSVNSRNPSWVIKEAFWAHPTWVYTCIIFYLRYLLKICLFFLIYRISE